MPGRRTLEGWDASIPALQAAEAAFPLEGLPGESWEAFLTRRLSPGTLALVRALERQGDWKTRRASARMGNDAGIAPWIEV